MKKVIGGSIAIILGLLCFSAFFSSFLTLLASTIPLMLIAGGCLTIYLNYENESPECSEATTGITKPPAPAEPLKTKPASNEPEESEPMKTEPTDSIPKFLGNTGTLVFHSPDCKFSKSKKCTITFDTREKAIQKDYKPCGICKP